MIEDDLMGKPAKPEGWETLGLDAFRFAGRQSADADRADAEALQGLVPDLLEEIKMVLHTLEVNGGNKEDFFALFKLVRLKYPREKAGRHLGAINAWIAERVPFELLEPELDALWE